MGNSENKIQVYDTKFKIKEKKNHNLLGDITIYEKISTKKLYSSRDFMFNNESDYNKKFNFFKQMKEEEGHCGLSKIEEIKKFEDNNLCSSYYKLTVYYEYFSRDFSTEIKIRKLQNARFTESQLMKYLKQLANALEYLQINGIKHRNLRMNSITIDDTGSLKLIDPRLIESISYLDSYLSSGLEPGVYLSPECLENLRKRTPRENFDIFKSDMFSLGCLLLEAAAMKTVENAFDASGLRVKMEVIEERLNSLNTIYSEKFINLLRSMTEGNPRNRIDFIVLKGFFDSCDVDVEASSVISIKSHRSVKNHILEDKENNSNTSNQDFSRIGAETFADIGNKGPLNESSGNFNRNSAIIYKSQYLHTEENIEKPSNPHFSQKLDNSLCSARRQLYEDNSVYEGDIKNGQRHGKGRMSYSNGCIYEGDWLNNKRHGYGLLYYYDGNLAYEGEWEDDYFSGKGILYYCNELEIEDFSNSSEMDFGNETMYSRYEGDFVEGKRHGMGTLYFLNNSKYTGRFFDDFVHGNGTFFNEFGEMKIGKWEENCLISAI